MKIDKITNNKILASTLPAASEVWGNYYRFKI